MTTATAARPDNLRWARIFAVLSIGLGLTAITGAFGLLLQMAILSFTLAVLYAVNRRFSAGIVRAPRPGRPSRSTTR